MLWVYSANPVNTHTDTHAWTDTIIPAMDYVVVADSVMTDTAKYADMVLPIAQWFELEEVSNAGQIVEPQLQREGNRPTVREQARSPKSFLSSRRSWGWAITSRSTMAASSKK